jgi:CheY-like chemotaxis protein
MKRRVLVVEDESLIALFISEVLESKGFEVIGPCQTVSQALVQLANPDCCDAAVLDASLRNESAAPVANVLTKLGIPFVVATGYNRSQLPPELAAVPILAKPVTPDELLGHIQHMVSTGRFPLA